MQKPFHWICLPIVALSLSCSFEPEGLRVANHGKPPVLYPAYGEPIILAGSQYIAIPFWMYSQESEKANQFYFSSGFGSNTNQTGSISLSKVSGDYATCSSVHWNNLIFCDKQTGACRLLLDHKAVIISAWFPDPEKPESSPRLLLFGIVEQDTNGDGYINSDDAVTLYAGTPDSKSLIRLTPPNTQMSDVEMDGPDTLYVRVVRDSNGDHRFTHEDESMILRVDLKHPGEGRPVVEEEVGRRARGIIESR